MSDISILVVDDDPAQMELTVQALGECCDPESIATAPDGTEALNYLLGRGAHAGRDTRRQPRLVILDINLTSPHGIDVLKTVRANALTQSVPVVMLSASIGKEALDHCYESGVNSVVQKSTDYEELRRKMRQVHDFWILINEGIRSSPV